MRLFAAQLHAFSWLACIVANTLPEKPLLSSIRAKLAKQELVAATTHRVLCDEAVLVEL